MGVHWAPDIDQLTFGHRLTYEQHVLAHRQAVAGEEAPLGSANLRVDRSHGGPPRKSDV